MFPWQVQWFLYKKVLTASNKSGREAVVLNSNAMNGLSECNHLGN